MPRASAILQRETRDMSPVFSKRLMDPRLTSDRQDNFCWLIRRLRRIARMFPAILRSISRGDFGSRYKLSIDNILFRIAININF